MEFSRGERVFFDFESGTVHPADSAQNVEQEPEPGPSQNAPPAPLSMNFVGDILERESSAPSAPLAPTFKARPTGFPAHKKRTGRVSAFKQQRTGKTEASFTSQDHASKPPPSQPAPFIQGPGPAEGKENAKSEREQIDEENRQRLANMSEEEIERERNELFSSLSPALLQRLLARGNVDEGSNEQDWDRNPPPAPSTEAAEINKADDVPRSELEVPKENKSTGGKKVSFAVPEPVSPPLAADNEDAQILSLLANSNNPTAPFPEDFNPTPDPAHQPDMGEQYLPTSMHFPKPAQPPDLDPNSPTFLTDLHNKYFPNLPYDPSALSWMNPIDPDDKSSPYHPGQLALNASELRFDFKGALLPPSKAREIPVTAGLHHHSEAPEAAGYTIPELARLARSAVPAQRCIAYQTLGRVLYRLGLGEFGTEKDERNRRVDGPVQVAKDPNQAEDDDEDGDGEIADTVDEAAAAMATGLWNCIEEGKVIETLTEEASKERGHLTARTYAQEALWNWRRGGGRKRKAV